MADATETTTNRKNEKKEKPFRWEAKQIEQLINCLISFKSKMLYESLDFDANKPKLYSELRVMMAELNPEKNTCFGPVTTISFDASTLSEEELKEKKEILKKEKSLITKGKNRIQEKVKDIRQKFSKALLSGTRSGSGQIVYEHYDKLVTIWGGSANATPLTFGVETEDFDSISVNNDINNSSTTTTSSNNDVDENRDSSFESVDSDDITKDKQSEKKRKIDDSVVPKLIDNKRKHLERKLSSAQRDQLLLQESKEDANFRRELSEAIRESTVSFSQSVETIGRSITQLGESMCKSMEILSRSMLQSANNTFNPGLMYQNSSHSNLPQYSQNYPQRSYSQWVENDSKKGSCEYQNSDVDTRFQNL